jgi:HEAT repeat protein
MIAEAVAETCRDNPERLAPWLSDSRWFVVRNVVHILGWIGGAPIVGLLKSALRHPEPRVRQEVVAALGQVEPKLARPLLMTLLDGADSRMFCAVLHQLSSERDTTVAQRMLAYLQDPEFEQRPMEERRAIYLTLSSTGNDEILPELEAELVRGNWFSRNQEAHRQAVARCLARIGTPLARMLLERGAQSKRGPVRKACEDALAGFANRE